MSHGAARQPLTPARTPALSPVAALVRRHDPDRFLCALFAPAARRETLLLLCAFNHEIARAGEVAREPTLALIRLQWWREVADGAARSHEVAGPLGAALAEGRLRRDDLHAMLDGRALEVEGPPARLADFADQVGRTAGALAAAAGHALGSEAASVARLRELGCAYGVAGRLRDVAAQARRGRCLLPADVLADQGLSPEAVVARPDDARLRPVLAVLANWGRTRLREGAGRFSRAEIAAALPGVLARRDLGRVALGQPRPRGVGDRLAVLAAAARRRV